MVIVHLVNIERVEFCIEFREGFSLNIRISNVEPLCRVDVKIERISEKNFELIPIFNVINLLAARNT